MGYQSIRMGDRIQANMTFDFKSESVEFSRAHGCPPACIIQKAMERGAELAMIEATELIRQETRLRQKINAAIIQDYPNQNNGSH